jgi:hypothetical protein
MFVYTISHSFFYSNFREVIEVFLHYAVVPAISLRRKCQIIVLRLCAMQQKNYLEPYQFSYTSGVTDLVFSGKSTARHIL